MQTTEKLYDKNSYLQEFTATVVSCEQKDDTTYRVVLVVKTKMSIKELNEEFEQIENVSAEEPDTIEKEEVQDLEKDFEVFVRGLPKLEPIEFCGLAKILGVRLDEFDRSTDDKPIPRPLDKVLEEIMDKYLALPKRQRKEINQMLKDIKRGR